MMNVILIVIIFHFVVIIISLCYLLHISNTYYVLLKVYSIALFDQQYNTFYVFLLYLFSIISVLLLL